MRNKIDSCIVASLTKRNHATSTSINATLYATHIATITLITLFLRVLNHIERIQVCNLHATKRLRTEKINSTFRVKLKSCIVAFCKGCNHAIHSVAT